MGLAIDRELKPIIEVPRDESFQLFTSIYNNGKGVIDMHQIQVYLDEGLRAEDCGDSGTYDAGSRAIRFDPEDLPYDEITTGNYINLPSCTIVHDIGNDDLSSDLDVRRTWPTMHVISGAIIYDYTITKSELLTIRSPRRTTNTDSSGEDND